MLIQDDRTDEQKTQLRILVVATDKMLSGWGKAKGGMSYAAWATDEANLERTRSMVESRREMKRVRVIYGDYRPKGKGHLHVYVSMFCKPKQFEWVDEHGTVHDLEEVPSVSAETINQLNKRLKGE